jgi:hypothetical protein
MTSVGDHGCGFGMPLEAVRRQLLGTPDQLSFARDDSLLVVVFLTDEDDCSVGPSSDLFSSNGYGPLDSFRCPRYGVLCGGGLITDAAAVYGQCSPATPSDGGKLTDLAIYDALFTAPRSAGGIKDDPADLVVAGLYAPPTPFYTIASDDSAGCGGASSCTILGHSCSSASDASLFGDPAVRLDAIVGVTGGLWHSICDGSYDAFASDLQNRIGAALGDACVPGALADPMKPDCLVEIDGQAISSCSSGDPPCWVVEADPACPGQIDPTDGLGQTLHLRIVGASTDAATASCKVLVAQ